MTYWNVTYHDNWFDEIAKRPINVHLDEINAFQNSINNGLTIGLPWHLITILLAAMLVIAVQMIVVVTQGTDVIHCLGVVTNAR